ncbi:hypothetical protein CQ010_13495 [Arthrobacter sp. MYb211]|uniref:YciI family protein n=1 Tax=unclassified Arthrobacter TaxID=235627 RepID=UPI000CFD5AA2|nr:MULTISPECIES: YciI family protein [unclassified Arthrobacter]PRA10488.1 hypothetical protein CQ015_13485 [Arthrobacter sp. MYb221]PRC06058.1 hypothetical protein CQ010_13495 [Arthrobacter sp. MYb211]
MNIATHLLIHRYLPGSGPQPPSEEFDAEMLQWESLDAQLRSEDILISAYALQDRGSVCSQETNSELDTEAEIVFAVHAIKVSDEAQAQEIARRMPHLPYGSVEIRPLME